MNEKFLPLELFTATAEDRTPTRVPLRSTLPPPPVASLRQGEGPNQRFARRREIMTDMHPLVAGLLLMTNLQFQQATPPVAKKQPHKTTIHGEVLVDDYRWMREKSNAEVIKHLEAENAYTDAVMKATEPLQEELYKELLGRIKQSDLSVHY
ncbi:MAG TPA: hypothetical protein VEX38_07750, partial [Fimbriimonadaceae bacterium]|nr:hypothetical protein [Fimbriimonadaceae bacterium]